MVQAGNCSSQVCFSVKDYKRMSGRTKCAVLRGPDNMVNCSTNSFKDLTAVRSIMDGVVVRSCENYSKKLGNGTSCLECDGASTGNVTSDLETKKQLILQQSVGCKSKIADENQILQDARQFTSVGSDQIENESAQDSTADELEVLLFGSCFISYYYMMSTISFYC